MNRSFSDLMFEQLNPVQIEEALAKSPVIYIPIGTFEWHGQHLPVGNDAVKAHGLCLRAAERTGGLVMPALFYGTGGGHIGYPYTVMVDEETAVKLLNATLAELPKWGVKVAVILTGHFPQEQMDMVTRVADEWEDSRMKVLGLTDYMIPNPQYHPDHAAMFETSMLAAMDPDLVHIENLPDINTTPANDPNGKAWGSHRNNPEHPLYGIFGDDPRNYTMEESQKLLQKGVSWLEGMVSQELARL